MQEKNKHKNTSIKLIDHKKRKREKSKKEKKSVEVPKESEIYLSKEGYEKKSIFDYNDLNPYESVSDNYTLFERKKFVKVSLKNIKTPNQVEELLSKDNTNEDLQIIYAKKIVEKLNNESDLERRKILIEKMQKARIIINETIYKSIISNITGKELIEEINFIKYKNAIIESLENLVKIKDENYQNTVNSSKKALKLTKRFKFNQSGELGENNLYFYLMGIQLFDKIDEICANIGYYTEFINEMIPFMKNENFNNLDEDKKFRFNYISYILLDKKSITKDSEYNKIYNFLYGKPVKKSDLENLKNVALKSKKKFFVNYDLEYDNQNNIINFIVDQKKKINRKEYSYTLIKSYKADIFNDNILDLIKKNVTFDFESKLMKHTLPKYENQIVYYEEIKNSFEKNLKNILSSDAALKFFQGTYGKKYPKLQYHFGKEDVQNEIIKKIQFYPIFKKGDNGFTNPLDMSIIINSIPSRIGNPDIHSFNWRFLDLGMLLIIALHEIFGHYLRHYYSMLTGGIIVFDTPDDKDLITGTESGFFIEKKFIGIKGRPSGLGLIKCLNLLYSPNYQEYPILKKNNLIINYDIIETIYHENPDLFDFIKYDNNNNEEGEDDGDHNNDEKSNNDGIISLNDYIDTLTNINNISTAFRHCNVDEEYFIYFN
jgi:hypothetical protein